MTQKQSNKRILWNAQQNVAGLHGVADRTVRWVEEHQLLSPALWAKFVRQYRIHSDSGNAGWRGEYWGKMMRGAVMVYQYSHNETLHSVLTESVRDLLTAHDPNGGFSTYLPEDQFTHWDMWCRKYVMLGMEYYLEICTDDALKKEIVAALCAHLDAILERVGDAAEGKLPITGTSVIYGGMNSASILEPVVRLWRLTGIEKYHAFAKHILSTGGCRNVNIFEAAYRDEKDPYAYGESKAYEMMSCFEGLLEYYEATGDLFCRDAAIRFAHRVLHSDTTVIGCCGTTTEFFDHSTVRQTGKNGGVLQETCVTVTWMKLCRRAFAVTGDPAFLDALEQSYYNAYLSTLNTEGCHARNQRLTFLKDQVPTLLPFDSYSPLLPGIRGEETGGAQLLDDGSYYGCCAAIAAAGAAIFPQSLLWCSRDGSVLLALYESGTAECVLPSGQTLRMRVTTGYPAPGSISAELLMDHPERFRLCWRVPAWSERTVCTVNGEEIPCGAGIVSVNKEWNNGDTVRLEFDFRVRITYAPVYDKDVIYRVDWSKARSVPVEVEQKREDREYVSFRQGVLALAVDRRLGRDPEERIHITAASGEVVEAENLPAAEIPYPCLHACRISLPEPILLTDYASVGRLWNRESESAVWLPADLPKE